MRFSLLQQFNQGLNGLLRVQSQTFKTQEQISSGRRVTTPADDPVAASRILQINQDQSQIQQYIKNANEVENRLGLEEVQLEAIGNLLVRVRELTIQAGDGAMDFGNRRGIAVELATRLEELVDLANTRDTNGEYIFSGFKGAVKPFVQTSSGNFAYQGDDGQRRVAVSSSVQVAISDSGKNVFVDIPAAQNSFYVDGNANNTGNATISPGLVTDQANYDAAYPEDYLITFNPGNTYTVTQRSTGAAVAGLTNVAYTPGQPVNIDAEGAAGLGWETTVSGTPAAGDTFFINSTEKQSMMMTIARLTDGLRSLSDNPADQAVLEQLVADTLNNLEAAEDNLSQVRSEVGARMNTLESIRNLNEDVELANQEVLSEIRDLDYAEALSRLSFQTFTLEAAQKSFTRVSNLSLFNFLR